MRTLPLAWITAALAAWVACALFSGAAYAAQFVLSCPIGTPPIGPDTTAGVSGQVVNSACTAVAAGSVPSAPQYVIACPAGTPPIGPDTAAGASGLVIDNACAAVPAGKEDEMAAANVQTLIQLFEVTLRVVVLLAGVVVGWSMVSKPRLGIAE